MALTDKLTTIADAIRDKTGGTEAMTLDQMATEIAGIETGGGVTLEDIAQRNISGVITLSVSPKDYAFHSCVGITEAIVNSGPINKHAFNGCTGMTRVASTASTVLDSAFEGCSALVNVDFPNLIKTNSWAFKGAGIVDVEFPSLSTVGYGAFYQCKSLKKIDIGVSTTFGNICFQYCSNLDTVILRSSSMVPLANVQCFANTPFASGGTGGTVYAPSALITSYQTETNWSTLYAAGTCNVVAIEGSEYE